MNTHTLTIDYPDEVLWATAHQPRPRGVGSAPHARGRAKEQRRVVFMLTLGQYGLSPFGESADELEEDLRYARQARDS